MLFRFIARLGLDVTDFTLGVKQAQTQVNELGKTARKSLGDHFGGEIRNLGSRIASIFTVASVEQFASHISNVVGEIKDMSELLGMSLEDVQLLQKAASGAGQSFGSIVSALQRVDQVRAMALNGEARAGGLFSILGIDPTKGTAKDIIKAALDASSRGVHENAAAFELLGKKAQGLRLTLEEMEAMGPVKIFTEEDIQRIDFATKKLEEAKRQFQIASAPAVATLLEGATGIMNMFNPAIDEKIADINRRRASGEFGHMKAIELRAATFLGMGEEENRRFGALDLQEALRGRRPAGSNVDTAERLLERIAAANEATLSTLESATKQ